MPGDGHPVEVTARNDDCCEPQHITVTAADVDKKPILELGFLPGFVIPRCTTAGVTVEIDKHPAELDKKTPILFGRTTHTQKTVDVEFFSKDTGVDKHETTVHYNETVEVTCTGK
jgi:hypothetical protein